MGALTIRPAILDGRYSLRGSYAIEVATGAVTVIAAGTASAGHLLAFRWSPTVTTARCILRYVAARFTITTPYTTAQETGCDLILTRAYTASHTAATAIDLGSTVATTNARGTVLGTSLMGVAGRARVASNVALTNGTHTIDANPIRVLSGWPAAIGDTLPTTPDGDRDAYGVLHDARDNDARAIFFATDEGFIVRNRAVMGAVGVGRWDFRLEWDEVDPIV